jgi:hypothetical protein
MQGDSARNEGIRNIAEFHDRAIPLWEASDGSANAGVARPTSPSVNEGVRLLMEFAEPVQQFHGKKASADETSHLPKGGDARSENN